jgi:hypothetical protein
MLNKKKYSRCISKDGVNEEIIIMNVMYIKRNISNQH